MRILKIMADYDCFPLWEATPGQVGNVDPGSLPISKQLQAELAAWAQIFNHTLNQDDPQKSGFVCTEEEKKFKVMGRALGERLQAELGADFMVKVKV